MSPAELWALLATSALALGVLLGLRVRTRARRCWSFAAYLATVAGANGLMGLSPDIFYHWWFWLGAGILQGLLALVLATELTVRIVRNLPGAQRAARWTLLTGLLLALALMWSGEVPPGASTDEIAQLLTPRLSMARTAAFISLLLFTRYYHLPLDPLHSAVVTGMALYSVVAAACLEALRVLGWGDRGLVNAVYSGSFLVLLLYWNHAAWRKERELPAVVVRRLWPWR